MESFGSHVRPRHENVPRLCTRKEVKRGEALLRPECVVLDHGVQRLQVPPPGLPALPYLTVHEGLQCLECTYVCLTSNEMKAHVNGSHLLLRRPQGAQPLALRSDPSAAQRWQHVPFQWPNCSELMRIDQICISQDDLDEKTSQIQLMKSIYQKAYRVTI